MWHASITVLSSKLQTHTDVHFEMRNAASPLWGNLLIRLIHGANSAIYGRIYSKSDLPSATLICRYYPPYEGCKVMETCDCDKSNRLFCESDYAVFKFSLSWSDPHHSSPPISLIRHSHTHTHIRWSPFCFAHWMAGCSSRHHKNNYAKQAALGARGTHQKTAHT